MHKAKHLKVECSSYVTVIKHFRCKSQRNIKRRGRQSRVEAFTERGETLERNEQEYLVTGFSCLLRCIGDWKIVYALKPV